MLQCVGFSFVCSSCAPAVAETASSGCYVLQTQCWDGLYDAVSLDTSLCCTLTPQCRQCCVPMGFICLINRVQQQPGCDSHLLLQALSQSRRLWAASESPGKLAPLCAQHHTFPRTAQSSADSCRHARWHWWILGCEARSLT